MRDDHYASTDDLMLTQWDPSGGENWSYWGSVTGSNFIARTYRSDITTTLPENGEYVRPTAYMAFFSTVHSPAFDYTWDWNGWNGPRFRTSAASSLSRYAVPGIGGWGCSSSYPHIPLIPYALVQKAEASAINLIKNSNLNLGQTFGEMGESIDFMSETLVKLVTAFRFALARKPGKVIEALGLKPDRRSSDYYHDAASTWNAYQYGWKPLMSDVYNSASTLRNGLMPNARADVQVTRDDPNYSLPVIPPGLKGEISGEVKRGVEVGITYGVKNQTLWDLDRYGLTDPLTLAWDLLPLSFVVDWFTGVQAFLDALSPPLGLAILHGYRTDWLKNDFEVSWWGDVAVNRKGNEPYLRARSRSSRRQTYWNWPIATPYVYMNFNRNMLSKGRNLIALVAAYK